MPVIGVRVELSRLYSLVVVRAGPVVETVRVAVWAIGWKFAEFHHWVVDRHGTATWPDGLLPRVTDGTWVGTLNGWKVHVCEPRDWRCAIITPQGRTRLWPPGTSLADGSREAKDWMEPNPLVLT